MVIEVGQKIPGATLHILGEAGPEQVSLHDLAGSGRVALFGLPGAFTRTCTAAHVPSFIRCMDKLKAKGVSRVICVAVNDAFCMEAWGDTTGATAAGIEMLGDPASEFTKAIGMNFTVPESGFHDRCKRFTMLIEDGDVMLLNVEEKRGVCELSSAETLLEQIKD